ncbi:hypothetical protein X474_09445 [Dethiosulfatarculus sandiegensis]|uniref:Uncharacterized protein n=1 Tax=Dethiosulfatarculus sandiegensis TaxID=1429043 RepID=A0A0D2GHM9_9BACT|nr:hypothetical protein X474_09445 [Dethiosulfatarculus sandiegensis]
MNSPLKSLAQNYRYSNFFKQIINQRLKVNYFLLT